MTRFGISPAFVFSRYGTGFTVCDYCASLAAARKLRFECFQPEIYFPEALASWAAGGAREVQTTAADLGLTASQFVGHFLLENFSTPERLAGRTDLDSLQRVIEVAKGFTGCRVLTVPMAPFRADSARPATARWYSDQRQRHGEKIRSYLALANAAGLDLALEILPFSLLGNFDGFLKLASEIDSARLGVNLDTGHAWASREIMELLPAKLAGRIFGLHLKDNNSDQNCE